MDKIENIKNEFRSEFRYLFNNRSKLTRSELFALYRKTFFKLYGCRQFRRKVRSILEMENLEIEGYDIFWAGRYFWTVGFDGYGLSDIGDEYVSFKHHTQKDYLRFKKSDRKQGFVSFLINKHDSWGRDRGLEKAGLIYADKDDFARLWGLWYSEEDPKIAGKIADLMR